ncbi:hypothetical protein EW146_g7169 [Bondarzewia mesenterica]|uniref:DUF6534 domain-containing protein n=1 Tax=Bondarzewia mesenterica TaxID=1095465 RepID=A0A4S4LM88_9AGAM|nr:hypothetical protein EW146_g7169 [Bondarzewia mesenterica]
MSTINLNLVMGPLVLASMLNYLVYGICIMQFYEYYASGYKDDLKTRLFVIYLLILDTFATALNAYLIWHYTVDGFGNDAIIGSTPWSYNIVPILSVFASVPIQHFLSWRIRKFAKSWILFCCLSIISLVSGVCGIVASASALRVGQISNNGTLLPFADTWLASATFCDVSITALLFFHLSRARTGFSRTDTMIFRLLRISLEAAVPVTVFTVCDLAILTSHPTTNVHMIFAVPMGRIYTNTLLTTLNMRAKPEDPESEHSHTTFHLDHLQSGLPTQVHIAVDRDVVSDSYSGRANDNSDLKSNMKV